MFHFEPTIDLLKVDTNSIDNYSTNMCLKEICFDTSMRNCKNFHRSTINIDELFKKNLVTNLSKYTVIDTSMSNCTISCQLIAIM